MVKRKTEERIMQGVDNISIPLAIQSFIWGRTAPFFREKLGTLYEASCVLFEHMFAENKFHCFPPPLSEAVTTTSRRDLIETALPHVMYCVSIMLSNRNKLGQADKFGVAATKLLHTFHSALYESMETIPTSDVEYRLRAGDICNIQLFVFLFAPLANTIKESDLTFRLASGLKTWEALWNHEIPDAAAMNYAVRPAPCKSAFYSPTEKEDADEENECDDGLIPASSCQVTAFDIAVLRCMFFPRWSEEGLLWAVTYLLKRLLPQSDGGRRRTRNTFWRRSKSVSTPKFSSYNNQCTSKEISTGERLIEAIAHDAAAKENQPENGQIRRHRGFLHRLRFSDRTRKPKSHTPRASWAAAFKDLAHSSDTEEKNLIQRKESSATVKTQLPRRSLKERFQRLSLISSRSSDDPPAYESLVRGVLRKQSSFDAPTYYRQLQRMPNVSEGSLPESDDADRDEGPVDSLPRGERPTSSQKAVMKSTSIDYPEKNPKATPITRRWASDTCVSYEKEKHMVDSKITSTYVTSEGFFRCDVILEAIEVILSRDPSVKIYDATLQILDCIMRNTFIQKMVSAEEKPFAKLRRIQSKVKFTQENKTPEKSDILQLIKVLLKFTRSLGCVRKCSRFGNRGAAGERLRLKARSLLIEVYLNYGELLCEHLSNVLKTQAIKDSIELLHLIFIACEVECDSTELPATDKKVGWIGKPDDATPGGKMKSAIANHTFEAFITKCLAEQDDLYSSHYRPLYRAVREIVQYIKQKHGSIFNKLLLDVLMKSTRKLHLWKKEKEKQEQKLDEERENSASGFLTGQKSANRRRGAVVFASSPLLSRANNNQQKSTPKLRSRFSTFKHDDDPLPSGREYATRTASVFGKIQISNWLKIKQDFFRTVLQSCWDETLALDKALVERDAPHIIDTHCVLHRHALSSSSLDLDDAGSDYSGSGEKQKNGERSFMSRIKGKTVRKQMSEPPNQVHCEDLTVEETPRDPFHRRRQISKNKNFMVDTKDIYSGVQILRFLLESCPPGTVPEPKMVAAVVDMEAPVVCRAAFFLEIAAFVHRCSNSVWPRWMSSSDTGIPKMFVRDTRKHLRNNTKLQANAGKLFYMWGEALAKKLECLYVMESGTTLVLPNVRSDAEKIRLREKDIREDFLCDSLINRSGSACPVALKMMVTQVMHEITTFIKDAAPHYMKEVRKTSRVTFGRAAEDDSGTAMASDSSIQRVTQAPRRRSISFLDDPEKKLTKASSQSHHNAEAKPGRRSAPEASLRSDFKSTVFHSPNTRRLSTTTDHTRDSRLRSASTVSILEEVRENSPLISVSSASMDGDNPAESKHGRKGCVRPSTNFLTVPSIHIGGTHSNSSSLTFAGAGSSLSLGEGSPEDDTNLNDRAFMSISSVSIASSHLEGNQTTNSINTDPKQEEEWISKTPWLQVMLAVANQQNFVCEHKHFCHAYCHQRLVRSCKRLIQALCKALDSVDSGGKQIQILSNGFRVDQQTNQAYNSYVSRYLKTNAASLMSAPILVLTKAAASMSEEMIFDVQSFCWEMILDEDKDIASAAASLFLLCAVKAPKQVFTTITSELTHSDANLRLDAILKFRVLWECRQGVWQRAQEGATRIFKLYAPGMNYTLPKDTIGTEFLPVPDAPWLPRAGTAEEAILASTSETENSALLTTDTTAHHKEKQMKRAIRMMEDQRSSARRKFHLTDIPIIQMAAAEIQKSCFMVQDDEDAFANDSYATSRRYSHAPSISSSNYSAKETRSGDLLRPSSRQFSRASRRDIDVEHKSDEQQGSRECTLSKATAVFPPCVAACIPTLVKSCKDMQLSKSNFSVAEIARNTLESCLVEDSSLFLRHMFESLSRKDGKQSETARLLQKLPLILGRLSPHVAYTIFRNVLGIMMKAVRPLIPACDRTTIACRGVLTSVAPFVEGLEFKNLKMTLRKEQSELELLTTSGLPGPRKLTVWTNDYYMPLLVDIDDNTTFENVIVDAMQQGGLSEKEKDNYQLIDRRLNVINCPNMYVGDVYSFSKKSYADLKLVEIHPEEADRQMKDRTILFQLEEINKLRFTLNVLVNKKTLEDKQVNASFILEEFLRLKCFPRKAIQAPFPQFKGERGSQIYDLDMIQKTTWIQLISTVFHFLPTEFPWSSELMLFLNVWNAALAIHAQQKPILRWYGAAVIDAAVHMNHQFIKTGYSIVLPVILEVYSEQYNMPTVKDYIEFLCKQLQIIHRHPFVLELIACAAPLLTATNGKNQNHLTADQFFTMIQSLEQEYPVDRLQVLELVRAEQPLHSLDFCYKNDNSSMATLDCFRLCVTVIACQPEGSRTLEMLVVLDQILPFYMKHLHAKSIETKNTSNEFASLKELVVCIRSLLVSLECLTRNLSHAPQQHPISHRVFYREGSTYGGARVRWTPNMRDDSIRIMEEGTRTEDTQEKFRSLTEDFLGPRDVVLNLCSNYFTHTKKRLQHIEGNLMQNTEILSDKSHTRLAEIAQSLLKLLTEESFTVKCPGLLTYLTEMIPDIDWSEEHVRSTLFLILKRLDRLFAKINGMSETGRQNLNWNDLHRIIEGLANLINNQPVVSVIPHVKSIVTVNLAMLIGSAALLDGDWSPRNPPVTDATVPTCYEPAILQLTMAYMSAMKSTVTLEDLVRHFSQGKRDFVILNFFIPLCTRAACLLARPCEMVSSDQFPIRESDVMFMFEYAFEILEKDSASLSNNISQLLLFTSPVSHRRTNLSHQTSLLLLKVLVTCFHKYLRRHWFKIASAIQKIVIQRAGNNETWFFMDFIMSIKTPLILYLRPFVLTQMSRIKTDGTQVSSLMEGMKTKSIKMQFNNVNLPELMLEYERETTRLKAEITANAPGFMPKVDRASREGHRRSFRRGPLAASFRRKSSERCEDTGSPKRHDAATKIVPSSQANNHLNPSSRYNTNSLGVDNPTVSGYESSDQSKAEEKGNFSMLRKSPLRRQWTLRSPSRPIVKKSKNHRHSVSTTENTATREDTPNSPSERRSQKAFKTLSNKASNSLSPFLRKAKKAVTESDDDAPYGMSDQSDDRVSLLDDVFDSLKIEKDDDQISMKKKMRGKTDEKDAKKSTPKQIDIQQKETSTTPSAKPLRKTSEGDATGNKTVLSSFISNSNILVCVTAPTPPGQRRASCDIEPVRHAVASNLTSATTRSRKISTASRPNVAAFLGDCRAYSESDAIRERKLSPVIELKDLGVSIRLKPDMV